MKSCKLVFIAVDQNYLTPFWTSKNNRGETGWFGLRLSLGTRNDRARIIRELREVAAAVESQGGN